MTHGSEDERTRISGSAPSTPPDRTVGAPARLDAPSVVANLRLRDDVELVGPVSDGGFTQQQWLITRGGDFIQVTELLYRVAEQADGTHSLEEMAAGVTADMPFTVTAEHIERIVATKLAPLGLIAADAGTAPPPAGGVGTGPLRIAGRVGAVGPRVLDPVTGVLQVLFRPVIAVPALLLIVTAHVWVYLGTGLGTALVDLIQRPLMVVPLFGLTVLAGAFHELGHAAALRYGGGRCRTMGFGFYLIYPALFTDTSDAYRLDRRARLRTDVGGFYFHQLFALVLVALAALTGQPLWLLAVLIIDLEMLRQLLFPFVRFDGYWLLADLTGIPDLYTHFGAVARRRLTGEAGGDVPVLRPWPRRVFAVYAAVAVPVLAGLLVLFVVRAPGFVRLIWASWQTQAGVAAAALRDGDPLGVAVPALQMLLLTLPLAGGAYLLFNLARMARRMPRPAALAAPAGASEHGTAAP